MKNVLRLKKGSCLPFQDLLEMQFGQLLLNSSIFKTYTENEETVKNFISIEGNNKGYRFHYGDGAFLLDNDYEVIIRKVSKKRMEKESIKRIKEKINNL
jgi:hypothetical protein